GIPHFDNKYRVEEVVRAQEFPSHVIIRPVFFMENLLGGWGLQGDKLMMGLKPETALQMVAVADIGKAGAQAFTRAEELNRREFDLGADAVTMPEVAKLLGAALGRKIEFVSLPIAEVRKNSEDVALMLEWFERVGYSAKVSELDQTFGHMLRFEEWVKTLPKS
ncbi:MAG TPA: NmrA family NAD(P)-binding protein, partial [Polyangiaceae bacterium]|nr:NmrA family NAD(P)-binding protein [Polyangiaceae bacterium]